MKQFISGKIDLHMHSNVSDGSDTPEEIISHVKDAGIELFSLTDHDAVKGSGIVREHLETGDPAFISGVEFSCKLEFIKNEFGFVFPEEEIRNLLSMDNPGKPHIGNLMVKYGYAESRSDAIKNYIDRLHVKNKYLSPGEAISGILESGGIPVLAHPFFGNGDQLILGEEMEDRLKRLIGFGLQGVEAFYSGFSPKLITQMLDLADRYQLYVTAGSDYHGKNKLVVPGDTGMLEDASLVQGMVNFLDTVRICYR